MWFYRLQTKLRNGYVFTLSVILFPGGSASVYAGIPPTQTHPWSDTPLLCRPPQSPQTATAADGTHPTGMHSCFFRLRFSGGCRISPGRCQPIIWLKFVKTCIKMKQLGPRGVCAVENFTM